MGWLFAVALGLQDGGRRAVWRALVPLGVGHAFAVGLVVGLAALTGIVMPIADPQVGGCRPCSSASACGASSGIAILASAACASVRLDSPCGRA